MREVKKESGVKQDLLVKTPNKNVSTLYKISGHSFFKKVLKSLKV